MSSRRSGLRKSARKGVESSTENLHSNYESTVDDSEVDATASQDEAQELMFSQSEGETLQKQNMTRATAQPCTPPCPSTPTAQSTLQKVHQELQCQSKDGQQQQPLTASENDLTTQGVRVCRELPTKVGNPAHAWVVTCPANTEETSANNVCAGKAANDVGAGRLHNEQQDADLAHTIAQHDVRMFENNVRNQQRDAAIAAGLVLEEARSLANQELMRERLDEEHKLCMTNRELYEERERVAQYILEAPKEAATVVRRQLEQAIAEYSSKPASAVTRVVRAAEPVSQYTTTGSRCTSLERRRIFEKNRSADSDGAGAARAASQPAMPRLRRISSIEKVPNGEQRAVEPSIDARLDHIARRCPENEQLRKDLGRYLSNRPEFNEPLNAPPYNPMRIRSPAGRPNDMTHRQARKSEYDRVYGKPLYGAYPSSDTDLSEDYTTSQEDFVTVESRYAGEHGDWRTWPHEKMRLGNKIAKRRMRARNDGTAIAAPREHLFMPREAAEHVRRLEDALVRSKQTLAKKERELSEHRAKAGAQKARQLARDAIGQTLLPSGDDDGFITAQEASDVNDIAANQGVRGQSQQRSKLTSQRPTSNTYDLRNRSNNANSCEDVQNTARFMQPTSRMEPPATQSVSRTVCGANEVALEVPTFSGGNWATFLTQFENVAEHYQWNNREQAVRLHNAIRGDAANALSIAESKTWSYEKLVEHLEQRHGQNRSYGDVVLELMGRARRPGQRLADWQDEVYNIVGSASLSEDQKKNTEFFGFVYGLRYQPHMLNKVLSRVEDTTIDQAFKQAKRYEQNNGSNAAGQLMLPAQVNMLKALEPSDEQKLQAAVDPGMALVSAVQKYQPAGGDDVAPAVHKIMEQIKQLGKQVEKRFDTLDQRVTRLEKSATRGGNSQPRGGYRGFNRWRGGPPRNFERRNDARGANNRDNDRDQSDWRRGRGRGRGAYSGRGRGSATAGAQNDTRTWQNQAQGPNQANNNVSANGANNRANTDASNNRE